MKKIGLIAIVAVLVLGLMGVGYAMWSQTLTITGTVGTGSVKFDVASVSSTFVYKVMPADTCVINHVTGSTDPTPPAGGTLIASAVTTNNGNGTITMTYNNIFPTLLDSITGDVHLTYSGSVPAHIEYTVSPWTGTDLSAYNVITWKDGNNAIVADPNLVQLHNTDQLNLTMGLDPALLQSAGTDAEGKSGSFTITFIAYQWNETAP